MPSPKEWQLLGTILEAQSLPREAQEQPRAARRPNMAQDKSKKGPGEPQERPWSARGERTRADKSSEQGSAAGAQP